MPDRVLPSPVVGAEFPDGFTDDFSWRVCEHPDPELIRLRGIAYGKESDAVLDWPRNRWFVLFDRRMLVEAE